MLSFRYLLPLGLLLSFLLACQNAKPSQEKKTTENVTSLPSVNPEKPIQEIILSKGSTPCEEFEQIVDISLGLHLQKNPRDKSELLYKTWGVFSNSVTENIFTNGLSSEDLANALKNHDTKSQTMPKNFSLCEKAKFFVKENLDAYNEEIQKIYDVKIDAQRMLKSFLQINLKIFLKLLDPFSDFISSVSTNKKTGLSLLKRTSYSYPIQNNPNYFYIENVSKNSSNYQFKDQLVGQKITHFYVDQATIDKMKLSGYESVPTKEGWFSVSDVEYSLSTQLLLNNEFVDMDKISIRLANNQEFELALEDIGTDQYYFLHDLASSTSTLKIKSFNKGYQSEKNQNEETLVAYVLEGIKNHDALIIDLRGNGGGDFSEVASFVELFLPKSSVIGEIEFTNFNFQTNQKLTKTKTLLTKDDYSLQEQLKYLVVLTDHLTASASEIFASTLHDNNGALILGESSMFGKGIGQSVFPYKGNFFFGYLQLTNMIFRSPLHRPIHLNSSSFIHFELEKSYDSIIKSKQKNVLGLLREFEFDANNILRDPLPDSKISPSLEGRVSTDLIDKLSLLEKPVFESCKGYIQDVEADCAMDQAVWYINKWKELDQKDLLP